MNTEIYKWAKIALIMLVVFLGVMSATGLKSLRSVDPAYNSITVDGQGEAFAIPDVATFSFSVSADATTVADAQAQVTKKIDAILAKLKGLGIADKDVKTTDYSVYPKYSYVSGVCAGGYCPGGKQVQDGYTANHSVTVKVRKSDDAGKALAAAGDAGATNLSSLAFSVDDTDKVLSDARADAIKDARTKAKALADELGVRLGKVVSFSETSGGSPMPIYAQAMGRAADSEAKAPTLPTGENKATVSVSVTYEIK